MFEAVEVGNRIDKKTYKEELPVLREELLQAQQDLSTSELGVLVLVSGAEGAGKTMTVNLLLEWMDARGIETHAMGEPTDEERERPPMWRFWRLLPPRGRMAILLGSWYTEPILARVFKQSTDPEFSQKLEQIVQFEQMLSHEGFLLVKLWFHLSKDAQKKTLQALEADPLQKWRVSKRDWKFFKEYDDFRKVSEKALRVTGTGEAPWTIIEATDFRYCSLTVGKMFLSAIRERLDLMKTRTRTKPSPDWPKPAEMNIIRSLDLERKLDKNKYEKQLLKDQAELNLLTRRLYEQKRSMVLVFEGVDAAGKGGAIRRLTTAMDARNYRVISIAAPTDEERSRPYLWRFWRQVPRRGRVTIYDRSWYGRVLVERIEGFCSKDEWKRAFNEINAFEEFLTQFDIILIKFWLAISPQEQLRRFKDRQHIVYKQYKITEEDWRNRSKWDAYEAAAVEMIEKTSSEHAPWVLIESEDKASGRVKVMKTVLERLRNELTGK
jgi:polyphosphate:AMP phosphotransferase